MNFKERESWIQAYVDERIPPDPFEEGRPINKTLHGFLKTFMPGVLVPSDANFIRGVLRTGVVCCIPLTVNKLYWLFVDPGQGNVVKAVADVIASGIWSSGLMLMGFSLGVYLSRHSPLHPDYVYGSLEKEAKAKLKEKLNHTES